MTRRRRELPNIGLDLPNTALRTASFDRCACYSVFAAQPTVGQGEGHLELI